MPYLLLRKPHCILHAWRENSSSWRSYSKQARQLVFKTMMGTPLCTTPLSSVTIKSYRFCSRNAKTSESITNLGSLHLTLRAQAKFWWYFINCHVTHLIIGLRKLSQKLSRRSRYWAQLWTQLNWTYFFERWERKQPQHSAAYLRRSTDSPDLRFSNSQYRLNPNKSSVT